MWTDEQSLELIDLYRRMSVIWDPKHPNYYKKNLKSEAWRDIADALERDVDDCRNKMTSLLASNRRERGKERRSRNSGIGADDVYNSSWFAYKALAFLDNRSTKKKQIKTEIIHDEEAYTSAENDDKPETFSQTTSAKREKVDEEENMENLSDCLTPHETLPFTSSSQTQFEEPRVDNEINSFSNFISSKMQKYDSRTRIEVQRAIMNIIFEADEKSLNIRIQEK